MINNKHKALIERRLARLEKAINEDMNKDNPAEEIATMLSDALEFAWKQKKANDNTEPDLAHEWQYFINELDGMIETAEDMSAEYYGGEDRWDDGWDDGEEFESCHKLEQRVRVLERKLADEGILDGIKDLAGKISGKAADAKLSAEELVEKVKAELTNIIGGITNKIDDKVGSCNWARPRGGNSELKWVGTKESGGSVMSISTGDNRDLPHTKRAKDTITVQATVDTDKAKSLKDCVVNYDISINSNATTAEAPEPITGSAKLLSMLDSKAWEKIVNKFVPSYNSYVEANA